MEYIEKKIESQLKYEGVIVNVYLDKAQLYDGTVVKREIVEHPGGVGILPIDKDNNCYLVSQFRYPPYSEMTEIPAGKLEPNEDHLTCAARELGEETGFTSKNMIYLGYFYTSPGYSTEKLHLYLATDLIEGESHPDEKEFLNVIKIPYDELLDKVISGEITDGKTVIAVLKAKYFLNI